MKIEYNSDLKEGDEILFDFGEKKYVGIVTGGGDSFIAFLGGNLLGRKSHATCVEEIFEELGYPNKAGILELMEKTLGYSDDTGIWPYTRSLEDLRKFLDAL